MRCCRGCRRSWPSSARPKPSGACCWPSSISWPRPAGRRRVVPLREQSLELLGDEKALDALARGRLFVSGPLSLELLAAARVAPALVESTTSSGPDVLLVENYSTYFTLARTLAGHGSIGHVIWGAANQVTQFLPQVVAAPAARIWYFGDLDVRGLEIGAGAAARAARLGLPELAPSCTRCCSSMATRQPLAAGPEPSPGAGRSGLAARKDATPGGRPAPRWSPSGPGGRRGGLARRGGPAYPLHKARPSKSTAGSRELALGRSLVLAIASQRSGWAARLWKCRFGCRSPPRSSLPELPRNLGVVGAEMPS
jgi:hypothetical protein